MRGRKAITDMYLVAIAWMYVVVMMAVAEALAPNGTLLGAAITFVLYGVLPLSIVLYILATPARRRARKARETAPSAEAAAAASSGSRPDRGEHAAGAAVAAKREEA